MLVNVPESFERGRVRWRECTDARELGVDDKLWSALLALQQQQQQQQESTSRAGASVCVLSEARDTLDDVVRWAAPADQLRVLQTTSAAIARTASHALPGGAPIGADALFPLFVHTGTCPATR
jgi:hypothetical protein